MKNGFYEWLAGKLPKDLVRFCFMRVLEHGTMFNRKYSTTRPSDVTAITLLTRWSAIE